VGLLGYKIISKAHFLFLKNFFPDRVVYSHTSAREAANCRPSPVVHFDYFFSNLTLKLKVAGVVGLYNNLKSTFFIEKLYKFLSDRAVYSPTSACEAAICRPSQHRLR
jgi:hypothetical protein